MQRPTPPRTELVAFHGALCLVLATLEYLIPKPIPFMRLGLANLPILLALGTFDTRTVLLLAALKVVGQGLVGGTLFSYVFLFSAAGTLAAVVVMLASRRAGGRHIGLVGVSVLGALASNITQVLLAVALIFGQAGWLIGSPFVALGTASGVLLGLFADAFERGSTWLAGIRATLRGLDAGSPPPRVGATAAPSRRRRVRAPDRIGRVLRRRDAFIAGLVALPAFLFVRRLDLLGPLVALYLVLMLLCGRTFRPLFPLVATVSIVAANLLMPVGRVLFSLGVLDVTAGALETGLRKTLTYIGLVYLSYIAVRPGLPLPGRTGLYFGRVIWWFDRLLEARKPFDRRALLASLDVYLWSVYPPEAPGETPPEAAASGPSRFAAGTPRTRAFGWLVAVLVAMPPWVAVAAQVLWPA